MNAAKMIKLTQAFDTGEICLSPEHLNFKTLESIERHDKHNETRVYVRLVPNEQIAGEPRRGYRFYFVRETPDEILQLMALACDTEVSQLSVADVAHVERMTHIYPMVNRNVYHPGKPEESQNQKPVFDEEADAAASPASIEPAYADFTQTIDGISRPIRVDLRNTKIARVLRTLDRQGGVLIVSEDEDIMRVDGTFEEVCEKIYGKDRYPHTDEQRKTLQTRIRRQRRELRKLNVVLRELNLSRQTQYDTSQDIRRSLLTQQLVNTELRKENQKLRDLGCDARRVLVAKGMTGGLVEDLKRACTPKEQKDV